MFTEEAQRIMNELLRKDPEVDFLIDSGIERYRKGFGTVVLLDAQEQEIEAASIRLKQRTHEYRFGCNAFMIV